MFQFFVERRSLALLIGLIVVCFTLMTLSVRFRGQSTLMERALLSLVGSAIQVADIPRKWSVELWQKYLLLKNAHEENIALKQKLQSLSANHAQVLELKSEIARLEKLLSASKNLSAPVRLARIVARNRSIFGESLLVDLGSRNGVRKNMPVMHQAGLVGRISRVGNNVSQVLTLLDSRSAVNVIAQRSRAQGVFAISSIGESEVRYMPLDAEMKKGDLLISSGLGGIFPKGLPVAHITEILDAGGLFPRIRAKAIVDFSHLEEVMILITQPKESPWK
ncbi:MAG: rod shape-determining protein MreC [Nitrospinae bacterium]|nr:rod shape-determining protein MreC [Nitrospinota bacterium]